MDQLHTHDFFFGVALQFVQEIVHYLIDSRFCQRGVSDYPYESYVNTNGLQSVADKANL